MHGALWYFNIRIGLPLPWKQKSARQSAQAARHSYERDWQYPQKRTMPKSFHCVVKVQNGLTYYSGKRLQMKALGAQTNFLLVTFFAKDSSIKNQKQCSCHVVMVVIARI
jgi:hypothetical protein